MNTFHPLRVLRKFVNPEAVVRVAIPSAPGRVSKSAFRRYLSGLSKPEAMKIHHTAKAILRKRGQ